MFLRLFEAICLIYRQTTAINLWILRYHVLDTVSVLEHATLQLEWIVSKGNSLAALMKEEYLLSRKDRRLLNRVLSKNEALYCRVLEQLSYSKKATEVLFTKEETDYCCFDVLDTTAFSPLVVSSHALQKN